MAGLGSNLRIDQEKNLAINHGWVWIASQHKHTQFYVLYYWMWSFCGLNKSWDRTSVKVTYHWRGDFLSSLAPCTRRLGVGARPRNSTRSIWRDADAGVVQGKLFPPVTAQAWPNEKGVHDHLKHSFVQGKEELIAESNQPLLVALPPGQVQQLHGHSSSLQSRPKRVSDEPFVHSPEPALAKKIAPREVTGRCSQFRQCEYVKIGADETNREIMDGDLQAGVTNICEGYPINVALLCGWFVPFRPRSPGLVAAKDHRFPGYALQCNHHARPILQRENKIWFTDDAKWENL